ncbi:transmembrane protein 56-like protein isoform X1 [Tanacetum coccineum]
MPPARLEPTTSRLVGNTHTTRPKALGKWDDGILTGVCMCDIELKIIFGSVGSLYFLVFSDVFDESNQKELIINRSSVPSDIVLGVSIGYFFTDLAMIIWTYPTLGGVEYFFHHGLSLFAIIQSLISGQVQFYILIVLFTEITTPFVNLRWYLDVANKKSSTLYMLNGLAMFVGWLTFVSEASLLSNGILHLVVNPIGNSIDESALVLEDHQRDD